MAVQTWVAALGPFVPSSGTALASSTTLSDISPAPSIPLPANLFQFVGQEIEIHAFGSFSTTGTPTLLIGAYYGGVAGAALAASAATTTGTGAAAWSWQLYYRGQIRTLGSSGSIVGQGRLYLGTSLTAASVIPIPATAAARTVTIDTTAAKTLTIGAQWGTSSASNTITCDDISVKLSV
jgi:hypothetical protein